MAERDSPVYVLVPASWLKGEPSHWRWTNKQASSDATRLLYVAAAFFVVKIASTIWLVCQPDAATVTANTRGFAICHASQLSAILFVAAMLARTCVEGGPPGYIAFRALLLVVATAMVITVIRQRTAGEWYGRAHVIKQGRRRRHDHPGGHET